MTTEEPTSFRALCHAYEAAPAATRAQFLGWLASRWQANAQQVNALRNGAARETWLEPLPWDDDEPSADPFH